MINLIDKIRFCKTNRSGYYYNRLIQIFPHHCEFPTFWDHHIMAINKFNFATTIINPLKTVKTPARLLVARKARGNRSKKTKGALDKE